MSLTSIPRLFADIEKSIHECKYEKITSLCDKILEQEPQDVDAIRCKIISFIFRSMFSEALAGMKKHPNITKEFLIYEKAYCQYRLHLLEEALETCQHSTEKQAGKFQELKAQILYRLEKWEECISIYSQLRETEKGNSLERDTNLIASISLLASDHKDGTNISAAAENYFAKIKVDVSQSFEICYNSACFELEQGNLVKAKELLLKAHEIGEKTLKEEEGFSSEEVANELGMIQIQLAYIHQLQGEEKKAFEILNSVLKSKPSDISMAAIASNNIVAFHKAHDVFDSIKKMKIATAEGLENKLTSKQKRIITFNRCLLNFFTSQTDACREIASQLKSELKDSDFPILILASLCFRENRNQDGIDLMKQYVSSHPNSSSRVLLTLAQSNLSQMGDLNSACQILSTLPKSMRFQAAIVSLRISLHEYLDKNITKALEILDEALREFANRKIHLTKDSRKELSFLKYAAQFKLKHCLYEEAADLYSKVIKADLKDAIAISGFIIATSHFDLAVSENYAKKLPFMDHSLAGKLDADQLENLPLHPTKKSEKEMNLMTSSKKNQDPASGKYLKSGKQAQSEAEDICSKNLKAHNKIFGEDSANLLVKKKKRKRKNKDPKNGRTGNADPERWIPQKERSYFRKSKKKNLPMKGTQGASSANSSQQQQQNFEGDYSKRGSNEVEGSLNVAENQSTKGKQQAGKKKRKGKGNW